MSTPQITLYTNKVEIALREAKAEYSLYDVNLMKKPAWFVEKVNSVGKLLHIYSSIQHHTYDLHLEGAYDNVRRPSRLAGQAIACFLQADESLVILEFITDIFPETNLLPRDPVDRASARFLVNLFTEKLRTVQSDVLVKRGSPQELIAVIEELQKYMPEPGDNKGPYINGNTFTSIDAIAAAFLKRLDGCLKRDVGSFPEGEGIKAYDVLRTSGGYRGIGHIFRRYFKGSQSWELFLSVHPTGTGMSTMKGWSQLE
ncbi:hypothetical protein BDN71DRAFT_1434901 [Pleurotus eryngii]|uniref:GST N-terminal domain-containing protein n=1 Tax=Pleurotus eryngii TaxID=5323 RepID=A0A9P6D3W6_PLEER|nr:hypothetical protein BDN71DRAFT_1434901 [Pleurotus eryngii]